MKGRSGRSYGSITLVGAATTSDEVSSVSTSSITLTLQQQTEQLSPEENERSESATTAAAQMPSQVLSGGAASTPRTPNSPLEHGGNTPTPPTPGNTNSDNSPTLVDPSPRFVTITVDGEAVGAEGVDENTSYVTYVEDSTDATLYAAAAAVAANGQNIAYPVYSAVNDTIYSGSTQYYTTTNNPGATTVTAYTQDNGVTYLVPTTNSNNSNNNSTTSTISVEVTEREHNLSHANRISPATVSWLLENYETAEGVSLPRSTLYYHYLRHCKNHKLDPCNAASFGKLIRSVFLGLRTRRLGTRGNSKYHYYGIRLKPNSPLVNVTEENDPELARQNDGGNTSPNHRNTSHGDGSPSSVDQNNHSQSESGDEGVSKPNGLFTECTTVNGNHQGANKRLKTSKVDQYDAGINNNDSFSIQQYIGDYSGALDMIPELSIQIPVEMPKGLHVNDIIIFGNLYKEHCESLLEILSSFQLSQVEIHWKSFWRTAASNNESGEIREYKFIPKQKLLLLSTLREVQDFVRETDYNFYQTFVGILLPDVLRPIPCSMTQAIRNFAKTLETWLTLALVGYPEEMLAVKVSAVNALSQTLRRYTSLNHLAQAARAVLQNQSQITQMLSDLNRVDFHNVEEQASWVCGCSGDVDPHSLEQEFKATLAQQYTLEQWAIWLEGVVDRILGPHIQSPRFVQIARQFLLKWSFYSSLVIRDLTLRSAASFGSFHLIRLLYDEYMFYLVENRVAQVTGSVVIAVMGKKSVDGLGFHPSMQNMERNDSTSDEISGSINPNDMYGHHNGNSPNPCTSSPNPSLDIPSPNSASLTTTDNKNTLVTCCSVVVVTDMLNHKHGTPANKSPASSSSTSSTSENNQIKENTES